MRIVRFPCWLFALAACSAPPVADAGDASMPDDAAEGSIVDAATLDATLTDSAAVDSATTDAQSGPDGSTGPRPHPLYPLLDLGSLPGGGGSAAGPYEPPALPRTNRTVTITETGAAARQQLATACLVAGTAVTVPDRAARIGTLDLGNSTDCDIQLGRDVAIDLLYIGHLPGPMVAPSRRIRVRGGQIAQVMVDPGSTDVVLDGVVINTGLQPASSRSSTGIYLINNGATGVDRFAVVNSIVRMVATAPSPQGDRDGCAYLAANASNVLFANNNVVTAGNRNSWGFRIGGGRNYLFVDNAVRVSFHKLIRMNDGPVDYVYVSRGLWMREATRTAGGMELNDSFAQLGDLGTDKIFIHDPTVYLLSGQPVSFGASVGPMQAGRLWEARRIQWFARASSVVSDDSLRAAASACVAGARCDYGVGTHRYTYADTVALPTDPWRSLPAIDEDNPDRLPAMP